MTHVLKSEAGGPLPQVDTTGAAPPAPAPSAAFPPPPPSTDKPATSRSVGLLALLAATGLAIGIIMTILWLGAQGNVDDANTERDLALTERDTATNSLTTAQTELEGTSNELASTEQDLEAALAALEAAETTESPAVDNSAEINALEAQITELEAATTSAVEENTRLTQELEAASAEPAPAEPAEFDPASAPGFARWVGELLSSSSGSSRLGQAASTCFGTEVIKLIGVDAIGVGQNNVASGADRQIVIDAMVAAAGTCGLDRGLIF